MAIFRLQQGVYFRWRIGQCRQISQVAPVCREVHKIRLELVHAGTWIQDLQLKYAIVGFVDFSRYARPKEIQLDEVPKLMGGKASQDGQSNPCPTSRRCR